MSIPSTPENRNVLTLLQSLRMFLEEFEARFEASRDIGEIQTAESAMWSVALDAETRRNKSKHVKCPRVTRVEQ